MTKKTKATADIAPEEEIVSENNVAENETSAQKEEDIKEKPLSDVELALKKADEYKDLLQRLQAEFDNFRKRNAEAVSSSRNDGINDVITLLLPVMDNFERGLAAVEDGAAKAGMELIFKQLQEIFKKNDVVEIEALGKEFDADVHYAIAQEEADGNENIITEVFAKGYKRKNKILRYAMVKVAK